MSDFKSNKPSRGLGRGLSALMADADINPAEPEPAVAGRAPRHPDFQVPIERIRPNPDQPRRNFRREDLDDLAQSLRAKGVIQPLIVRPDPQHPEAYQIVAGERRWRAAQMAQLHSLPVIVRDFSDSEVLEVAIIENVQRADLNPVEEAAGYRALMEGFGHTQERLAEALGKSRSHIANSLRLLNLPEDVQDHLREGRLSAGHARALLTLADPSASAREVIRRGLNVRQTEKLGRATGAPAKPRQPKSRDKDADTRALEADLFTNTGLRILIDHEPGSESGIVTVRYDRLDQLDQVIGVLASIERDGSR